MMNPEKYLTRLVFFALSFREAFVFWRDETISLLSKARSPSRPVEAAQVSRRAASELLVSRSIPGLIPSRAGQLQGLDPALPPAP